MFEPGTFVTVGEQGPSYSLDDVYVVIKRHPEHFLSKVIACRFKSEDVELNVANISACDIAEFADEYDSRASDIYRCPACGVEANDKTTTATVIADGFANVSKQCVHCSHEYVVCFDYAGAGIRAKTDSTIVNTIKHELIEAYANGQLKPMPGPLDTDETVTVETVVKKHCNNPVETQLIVNALIEEWQWLGVHTDGAPFDLSIQDYNDLKYLLRHEGLIDFEVVNPNRAGEFDFELTEDHFEPVTYINGFDMTRLELLRIMNGFYTLEHVKVISAVRNNSGPSVTPRTVALDEWVLG